MTDDRRLEIERGFDGELDEPEPASPIDDPEARRHLDRLARLRELALRHDPGSLVPRRSFELPRRSPRRILSWLAVAATAAVVTLAFLPEFRSGKPPRVVLTEPTTKPSARPLEPTVGRPPLEVELYGWANTPSKPSGQVAKLVLSPGPSSKKRSAANEILALELANASRRDRSGVQRFAVAKGSKPAPGPGPKPGPPGSRAKSSLPDV